MTSLRSLAAMLCAGALVAGHPAPAAAQSAPGSRVLVMPFTVSVETTVAGGAGAAFWLGEAAAILVTDQIQQLGGGAFTRSERVAAFDRLQLPMSAALTRAAMIRVGELVGASEIVFGDVRLGSRVSVRAHLVRLDAGRGLPDVVDDAPPADLFALFQRVARQITVETGRAIVERAAGASPSHPPLDAFENYVKGLVAVTPVAQQRFLEAAFKSAPRDARVLLALWSVYSSQGAHEKALAVASEVPADSPLSRRARFFAALSLVELRRFDGALKALAALDAERRAPVLSNAQGVVYLRQSAQNAATAATFFSRAVAQEPGNTDYLFNLGYASALAKDTAAALVALREAVRQDAALGDAHLVMSAVLMGSGKTVEAGREFDLGKLLGTRVDAASLTLGDRVPAGLEHLPTDLDVLPSERVETAIGKPAQREQEETASFHLAQGRRWIAAQNDRDALNELRRAIYLSPYEEEPHVLLGQLYLRGGRVADAIDEFKVAIWCRETVDARVALGTALLQFGDRDGARREAARALVLAPNSAPAQALMAKIGGAPAC